MSKPGLFIVFEGIDGSGKSTQIELLGKWLSDQGYKVVLTREPTDGQYGQQIRKLYTNREQATPQQELELFVLDRREHVANVIQPAVRDGCIVLSDRYYFSTVAYQGAAGLNPQAIVEKNNFAPQPDMVILITMSPEESVARIKEKRGDQPNDFEQLEQLKKVAALFDGFTEDFIVRVDGSSSEVAVQQEIQRFITPLLADMNV